MLLIIDNYDSFVFNIARYFGELGARVETARNDAVTVAEVLARARAGALRAVVISPGPCTPREAGVSLPLAQALAGVVPLLGVCLGHQCVGAAFGGVVRRAVEPAHGRATAIRHNGAGLFAGLPDPLTVGRYHSLAVAETPAMATHLRVDARSPAGEIMALSHVGLPVYGVQFHPESVLTEHGHQLLANFLAIADAWRGNPSGGADDLGERRGCDRRRRH
ncbi:anthranilate synthase component II [Camelimonas abortus]|uniref:Anthranilate synthase component II n=1 Tax=Camelimonas abortus TaxID=1017184 RepID=A0ABV7LHB6_9HYPH